MSRSRPRALSILARSAGEATEGRRPLPIGSRVTARRRSSYPRVPSGKGTTLISPWSLPRDRTGSVPQSIVWTAGSRPSVRRALISWNAASSRRRFSGLVEGVMSMPRVISSAPWRTRPSAPMTM
jgi:hypothetical protein